MKSAIRSPMTSVVTYALARIESGIMGELRDHSSIGIAFYNGRIVPCKGSTGQMFWGKMSFGRDSVSDTVLLPPAHGVLLGNIKLHGLEA